MSTAQGCRVVILRCRCLAASVFVLLLAVASLVEASAQDATPDGKEVAGQENAAATAAEANSSEALSAGGAADPAAAQADESSATFHQQIDQLLQPIVPQVLAAKEADGVLLRRLSLDLRGVVPTREELDAFAADSSADRWQEWVDQFLEDPLCDEHLVNFLDRTLMLRRGHSLVDRAAWIGYLRDQVAADKPLDVLSRELLYSPWWNQDQRVTQRFYLDRAGDPHLITRDLARVFLGRDLQCAQCHDHPLVGDFRQIDYHGLLAFVSSGSLVEVAYKDAEQKDQKVQLYVEKAAGDAPFESVFERGTMLRSGTRLAGQPENFDEYHRPDQRYLADAPADALAGVPNPPQVSRREQLAQRLADRDNSTFVANWANRLWALIYGRGLVHPVDMMEPDNPPTHPELFRLISAGLLQSDMRIKPFLRHLVMSEAYQRGSTPRILQIAAQPDDASISELRKQLQELIETMVAQVESLGDAEKVALAAYESAREAWLKAQAERTAVRAELDTAEAAMLDAKKKHDEANAAFNAAQKKLADSQTRATLLDESAAKLEQALSLSGGEDAELSQAIAVAKQRAEAARAQTPELEKGIADAQATVTAAMPVLEQATTAVDQIVAKLKPIQAALRAADEIHLTARETWSKARSDVVATRQESARLGRLADWLDELAKQNQLEQSIQAVEAKIAATQTEMDTMLNAIDVARGAMTTAEQMVQTANQGLTQAQQAMEQHQQVIGTLEQAVASLADATKLVSKSDRLVAAQDVLRGELTMKQMQLGQFRAATDAATANVAAKSEDLTKQRAELDAKLARHQEQTQQLASLKSLREQHQQQREATQINIGSQAQAIATDSENQLTSVGLSPLTAEQMCWSTLRVTGVLDAYIRTEIAELEKQSPLPPDADAAAQSQRQQQVVRQAIEKLRGIADHYISLYASGPDKTQDDYFASADQALYVSNGGSVFGWAAPGNNNPTQVATSLDDPAEIAKVLYWSYLCRQPTEEETALVTEQLASAGDQRNAIIQEMAWSLLASAEFRFAR